MMRLFLVAAVLSCHLCVGQARIVKLPELKNIIAENSGINVINFWATWCAPCVKELPLFEKVNAEERPGVKITLVSMDLDLDPDPGKVYRFVARKGLKSDVLLLDESDPNAWIDQIDKKWSGALPATLIVNNRTGKRIFIERSLREGDLERYLNDIQ